MAHGDAREGKWRGNWRMQWVASTLHTTSEHGVSSITTADAHTSAASSRLNWRPHADLNGLVRFAERRNLVYTRVPSHFKRSLLTPHKATHIHRFYYKKITRLEFHSFYSFLSMRHQDSAEHPIFLQRPKVFRPNHKGVSSNKISDH